MPAVDNGLPISLALERGLSWLQDLPTRRFLPSHWYLGQRHPLWHAKGGHYHLGTFLDRSVR